MFDVFATDACSSLQRAPRSTILGLASDKPGSSEAWQLARERRGRPSRTTGPATDGASLSSRARRTEIVHLLDRQEYVEVADLAQRYDLTEASVRRDLQQLEADGLITRVRGGAVARRGAGQTGSYAQAVHERVAEKRRIADAAAAMIPSRSVIFCDTGTTVAMTIGAIPRSARSGITVVTNSLAVVQETGEWENPHVVSLGGLYLPEYAAFVGPQAIGALQHLRAEVAILGCDGLTAAGGMTIAHQLIAEVGATMAQHSGRIIAVTDSRKIGRQGFAPFLPTSALTTLVTDEGADPDEVQAIRDAGVEVVVV
jgi:DeoR/GlpR family transcriptional regulator of sugar metabolism